MKNKVIYTRILTTKHPVEDSTIEVGAVEVVKLRGAPLYLVLFTPHSNTVDFYRSKFTGTESKPLFILAFLDDLNKAIERAMNATPEWLDMIPLNASTVGIGRFYDINEWKRDVQATVRAAEFSPTLEEAEEKLDRVPFRTIVQRLEDLAEGMER